MYADPDLWFALTDRLADLAIESIRSQVANGACAAQLFDSWVGALSPMDYERFVLPSSSKVISAVKSLGVPVIHFGVNTGELLGLMAAAGADVVGVDWRTPLDVARGRVPSDVSLQGNLDPAVVAAGWDATEPQVLDVLRRGGGNPGGGGGHIFNLGHGVTPDIDPGVLENVADLVHAQPVTLDQD